jgi:hypothetical protein
LSPIPPPTNEDNSRKRQSTPGDNLPGKRSKDDVSTVPDPYNSPKPGPSSAMNFAPIEEPAAEQSTRRQDQNVSSVPVRCATCAPCVEAAAVSSDAA